MKYTIKRILIAILGLITSLSVFSSEPKTLEELLERVKISTIRACKKDLPSELVNIKDKDPIKDAKHALNKGDYRFLALWGKSLSVPGVSEKNESCILENELFKEIVDISKKEACTAFHMLVRDSLSYSQKYNETIMNEVNDQYDGACGPNK